MKAAHDVLERVRSLQRDLIVSMEKLSEAYIELAYYDVSQYKNHTGSTIFFKKWLEKSSIAVGCEKT